MYSGLAIPIADPGCRKLLAYGAAWGIATGLAASSSAVLTFNVVGLGFSGIAIYTVVVALLRSSRHHCGAARSTVRVAGSCSYSAVLGLR